MRLLVAALALACVACAVQARQHGLDARQMPAMPVYIPNSIMAERMELNDLENNTPGMKFREEPSDTEGSQLVPIRKTNSTAEQSAEELASGAANGLENFAVNLRLRLKAEMNETETGWRVRADYLNTTIGIMDEALQKKEQAVALMNEEVAGIHAQIANAQRALNRTKEEIVAKDIAVAELESLTLQADKKWNQTVDMLMHQASAAEAALELVKEIRKSLDGPDKPASVQALLSQRREAVANAKLESLVQLAVKARETVQADEVVHFKDMLDQLTAQISDHLEDLQESVVDAQQSREHHMSQLRAKLQVMHSELEGLRDNAIDNQDAIPELYQTVEKYKDPIFKLEAEIKEDNSILDAWTNLGDFESASLFRQRDSEAARLRIAGFIAQTVKELLASKDPRVVAKVRFMTDILPAPHNGERLGDDLIRPRSTRPINALDMAESLTASWDFEEEDGSQYAIDASGNGNDGKLHDMSLIRVKPGHSKTGQGLSFDGVDDYVDVGRLGSLGSTLGDFTISFWVKTINTNPALASILKYVDDGEAGVLAIEPNRRIGRQADDGSWPTGQQGSGELAYQPGTTLVYLRDNAGKILAGHVTANYFDGAWHHLQWTVEDAPNNRMSFFMDGQSYPFLATIEQGPSKFVNLRRNLYLGAGNNRGFAEGFFDGALDDVQIFGSAQAAVYGKDCCRICYKGKPCGNMCIDANATCTAAAGCACEGISLAPPPVTNSTSSAPPPAAAPAVNSTGATNTTSEASAKL